jgi:hypothetical protein
MDQATKTRLAALCKTALAKWPRMKWSLRVRHHSTLVMTIAQGDIDFVEDGAEDGRERLPAAQRRLEDGYLQINRYYIERDWKGAALEFLKAAHEAMMDGNFDNSDLQSDYHHVGWYVEISVGRWDKPYRLIKTEPEECENDACAGCAWCVREACISTGRHLLEQLDAGICKACRQPGGDPSAAAAS